MAGARTTATLLWTARWGLATVVAIAAFFVLNLGYSGSAEGSLSLRKVSEWGLISSFAFFGGLIAFPLVPWFVYQSAIGNGPPDNDFVGLFLPGSLFGWSAFTTFALRRPRPSLRPAIAAISSIVLPWPAAWLAYRSGGSA